MTRLLPLALVQAPAHILNEYTAEVERLTVERPQVRLVVHPDLHLCEHIADAEPLDGPRDRRLAELAGDLGLWLAPGSVYEMGRAGQVHNTAVVYSPEGRRVALYRRVFPWCPYEKTVPGDQFVVFTMPEIGRLGLSICCDAWFPESTRHLAWLGAELVLNVVLAPTADRAQEVVLARANAIVNQVFVASVNAAAPAGVGRSLLVDPEGRVRVEAVGAEPTVLTDVIDLAAVDTVRRYGTARLNWMWQQWQPGDQPLALPMYSGVIDPATWAPPDRLRENLDAAHQAGPELPRWRLPTTCRCPKQVVLRGSPGATWEYRYLPKETPWQRPLAAPRLVRRRRHSRPHSTGCARNS